MPVNPSRSNIPLKIAGNVAGKIVPPYVVYKSKHEGTIVYLKYTMKAFLVDGLISKHLQTIFVAKTYLPI